MRAPELTFFCELDAPSLDTLLDEAVVSSLKTLRATLSLAVLDFSPQRAAVVRRLNRAGVPLTAWLLLPKEQGYWFNLDNAALALEFNERFRAWTQEEGLQWETIGLDIEPDIRDLSLLMRSGWRFLPRFMERLFWGGRLRRAERLYAQMVAQAHADGYHVEVYQLPFIAEERRARTTLLRRLSGLVDVQADREVWMLYTSFFRPLGAGMLASYAPQAQAIGLGVTGGGVEFPGCPSPARLRGMNSPATCAWRGIGVPTCTSLVWRGALPAATSSACPPSFGMHRLCCRRLPDSGWMAGGAHWSPLCG